MRRACSRGSPSTWPTRVSLDAGPTKRSLAPRKTFLSCRPPLAGIVLRDLKVREAIRQQKTIISIDPQAQAALDARQIAEALIRGGAENDRGEDGLRLSIKTPASGLLLRKRARAHV